MRRALRREERAEYYLARAKENSTLRLQIRAIAPDYRWSKHRLSTLTKKIFPPMT